MAKIKHTKNELKKQKDNLKRFTRYLPTLLLKKQQLQLEIATIYRKMSELDREMSSLRESVYGWVGVFAEKVGIDKIIELDKIHVSTGNIAGSDIPVFKRVDFKEKDYDFIQMPLWVDYAIEAVKALTTLKIRYIIREKQLAIIKEELRITTQRVNLFEKLKIPEAKDNIRKISIFLGDLQTAAVVTGKIAKKQLEEKERIPAYQ